MTTRTMDSAQTIVITPKLHTASVIFMHGLGDTAKGWSETAMMLAAKLPHIKFILPTATVKPVSLNMGMPMPSWYDIKVLNNRDNDDAEGIEDSKKKIEALIQKENETGIPHSRIVLGGFSQGAALSIYTGLQQKYTLGGVLSLSGYLPKRKAFCISEEGKKTPVLMCHGKVDPVVQFEWGTTTRDLLNASGAKELVMKAYPGLEHCASIEELNDVANWLQRVLPPVDSES